MRRVTLLALCAALLAACGGEDEAECPGESVATFHFTAATLIAADDPDLTGLDPVAGTPDCGAQFAYPPELDPFDATLSAGPDAEAAALCTTLGHVYFGQRSGDRYVVEIDTHGAVLGEECAPGCTAATRFLVAGDVVHGEGDAVSFRGVYAELMTADDAGACGTCLPCAARYALDGAP